VDLIFVIGMGNGYAIMQEINTDITVKNT